MSVIVYRDGVLAADRQNTSGESVLTGTKLFVRERQGPNKWRRPKPGEAVAEAFAVTGQADANLLMLEWYLAGANPDKFPTNQSTDSWGRLLVVDHSGVFVYEKLPVRVYVEDDYVAFGSGAEYALGAMYVGGSAVDAVSAASYWSLGCGRGIDWVRTRNGP